MSRLHRALFSLAFATALGACAPVDDDGGEPSETASTSEALTQCAASTVLGVDVSDFQGTIDWGAVRGAGVRFAYMKATQGTYNTNGTFAGNWRNTRAAGVLRGAYHFFDPNEDGVAQARHFLAVMGPLAAGDLPPMLDMECPDGDANCLGSGFVDATGNVASSLIRRRMLDFLTTVERETGRAPVIYTFNAYFSGSAIDTSGLSHYPLWIAWPDSGTCVSVPSPWTRARIYQSSWYGSIPGIAGNVDLDRFFGSMADLTAFAGETSSSPPSTSPPPGTDAWDCARSSYNGTQYWTCDGSARVRCDASGTVQREACQFGCYGRAAGTQDYCRSAAWTCDRSAYNGAQYWTCFNGEILRCVDGGVPVKVHCARGCTLGPPGTHDHCN